MPIRKAYLKKLISERSPVVKKARKKVVETIRWSIMINGKQVGDFFDSEEQAYKFITDNKLEEKLPSLMRNKI